VDRPLLESKNEHESKMDWVRVEAENTFWMDDDLSASLCQQIVRVREKKQKRKVCVCVCFA
jgi:hypothetical protein